ncbi:MAG TPA: CPBP family intramembrane metalloprotease [Chloroflexi bacterium]|jgi:membrane protease YdiL (CAAX protease family)|nr:CPBP family intramembrane metalloprotease [Chloroflexota bacterium]
MGSRVERGFVRAASTLKAEETGWKRVSLYGVVTLLLLTLQKALSTAGSYIAGSFSYAALDPDHAYAWNAVHHLTMMAFTLLVILALRRRLGVNFGLGLGDKRAGIRFVSAYTAILAGVSLVVHTLMLVSNALPAYTYPLSTRNVVGTLGFQLLLTGPTEELLYRALPLTILVCLFGSNKRFTWGITHEGIVAALLFALAHAKWSLFPLAFDADASQLLYSFAQGIIAAKAYQETRSVIYPMLMHSISNVLMVGTGYLFLAL